MAGAYGEGNMYGNGMYFMNNNNIMYNNSYDIYNNSTMYPRMDMNQMYNAQNNMNYYGA